MTAYTKREAAEQVIHEMPVGVAIKVRDLALKCHYNRFSLTSREMARYLREHKNIQRIVERPTDRFGRTLTVIKYRKMEVSNKQ